ncbi:fatty acid-binding protein DegV [Clostridium butyricum]|nr:fatty acid-binding protein DegV [Clostridium butyricum]
MENEEITSDEFITMIKRWKYSCFIAGQLWGDVINLYEKYPEDEIINITMADGLSGTYNFSVYGEKTM